MLIYSFGSQLKINTGISIPSSFGEVKNKILLFLEKMEMWI